MDPVVDDGGAAAEPSGGPGHGDLAVGVGSRGGDVVGVADPLHGLDVERAAVPGGQPGGVQLRGQFGGGGDGAEPADHLHRRGRAAPGGAGVDSAGHPELVGGAGVPADPDPDLGLVGFGQYGDVGDQGAQQPLAVLAAGGRGVPQPGQVGGEFFQLGPARQRRQRFGGGLQRLLGLGEGGEPGLPAGFQAAGDQPVLRLAGAKGALGPVGVVTGAFDRELSGPADPLAPAGHLVSRGERQRDLLGGQRVQQHAGDRVIDGGGGHRPAGGRGQPVGAGGALISRPLIGVVVGAHRLAAGPAGDDALAKRAAFPRRAGAGVGAVGRQLRLAGQVIRPGDVSLVVVFDQHRPLGAGPFHQPGAHRAVRVDGAPGGVPAVHVGSRVARVLQHAQDAGVGELAPAQLPGPRAAVGAQREPAVLERRDDPVGRSARGERGEHVPDGGLDLGIGVDHDIAGVVVHQPDRQRGAQLAALGRGALVGVEPLGHHVQFHFSHGALEAQQDAVVHIGRVVDAVRVDQNDRVLLGFKGTMGEMELHVMAQRLHANKRAAAERGELRTPLPVGLVHDDAGDIVIDPDAEVQAAIRDVFAAFTACGSAYGVVAAFKDRRFPLRAYGGAWAGQLRWGKLTHARVLGVLKNPCYAGAYVHGRYSSRRTVDPDGTVRTGLVERPRTEWPVLIKDHHEGYITWADYLASEAKLAANRTNAGARPPREGGALCQGIITCGSCGKPMRTNYHTDQRPAYECSSRADRLTTPTCRSVAAATVDDAVAGVLLDALTPEQVALALAAADEVAGRCQRVSRAAELAVERARYDADRAERAFCACEPENRLVARSLEARWEARLAALAEAEQALEAATESLPL